MQTKTAFIWSKIQ